MRQSAGLLFYFILSGDDDAVQGGEEITDGERGVRGVQGVWGVGRSDRSDRDRRGTGLGGGK